MDQQMATLHITGGQPELRFERRLAHPPEKVWKAITDDAELAHWFPARFETELRVGAPITFTFEGMEIDAPGGEIVEHDPPRLFAYRWGEALLRWEIVPDGSGSRLRFTHVLGGDPTWGDRRTAARHAAGWDVCFELLRARLDGQAKDPEAHDWFARNEQYVEQFGLAEGEVHEQPDGYLVRFERDLVQGVEQVWAALLVQDGATPTATTPGAEENGAKQNGAEVSSPTPGAPPPLRFTNQYVPAGPITEVEPPRVLEYAWHHLDGAPAGRVRWELRAQEFGSRVIVTQTIPTHLAQLRSTALAAWQTHLEIFVATLHGVDRCQGRGWPTERTEELQTMYSARLA
jgi:uncharacterized protein YndB with AHSA1/START domain